MTQFARQANPALFAVVRAHRVNGVVQKVAKNQLQLQSVSVQADIGDVTDGEGDGLLTHFLLIAPGSLLDDFPERNDFQPGCARTEKITQASDNFPGPSGFPQHAANGFVESLSLLAAFKQNLTARGIGRQGGQRLIEFMRQRPRHFRCCRQAQRLFEFVAGALQFVNHTADEKADQGHGE